MITNGAEALATELADHFGRFENVRAVALAGSSTTRVADALSDIDLYIYCDGSVPVPARLELARSRSKRFEVANSAFEDGDEWRDARSGIWVDIIYRDPRWIEEALADLLDRFQGRIGYSTCLWHNVLTARPLFDRIGWFASLQGSARRAYPQELVAAILAKNLPLLDERISSFGAQVRKAASRNDRVAVNHRIAAFLASYFDVLFAINRVPHPGEKRLREHAARLPLLPPNWERGIDTLLRLAPDGTDADLAETIGAISAALREIAEGGASRQP